MHAVERIFLLSVITILIFLLISKKSSGLTLTGAPVQGNIQVGSTMLPRSNVSSMSSSVPTPMSGQREGSIPLETTANPTKVHTVSDLPPPSIPAPVGMNQMDKLYPGAMFGSPVSNVSSMSGRTRGVGNINPMFN